LKKIFRDSKIFVDKKASETRALGAFKHRKAVGFK